MKTASEGASLPRRSVIRRDCAGLGVRWACHCAGEEGMGERIGGGNGGFLLLALAVWKAGMRDGGVLREINETLYALQCTGIVLGDSLFSIWVDGRNEPGLQSGTPLS